LERVLGMSRTRTEGLKLGAVSLGWVVSIVGIAIFGGVLGLIAGAFGDGLGLLSTVAATSASMLAGFLAFLLGGFSAARYAQASGGLNGAMVAVLSLVMGLFPAITSAIFGGLSGAALVVPQVNFGAAAGSLFAALILFLVNLAGGYVGGRLGEPSTARARGPAQSFPAGSSRV
jgi:hypothetical protein